MLSPRSTYVDRRVPKAHGGHALRPRDSNQLKHGVTIKELELEARNKTSCAVGTIIPTVVDVTPTLSEENMSDQRST